MHTACHEARTRRDRKAHRAILQSLQDPHPLVRFWACYAAGHLRLRRAQHPLRQLLTDTARSEFGWTVAFDAGEALKSIAGQDAWADHVPTDNTYLAQLDSTLE